MTYVGTLFLIRVEAHHLADVFLQRPHLRNQYCLLLLCNSSSIMAIYSCDTHRWRNQLEVHIMWSSITYQTFTDHSMSQNYIMYLPVFHIYQVDMFSFIFLSTIKKVQTKNIFCMYRVRHC